ncbi:helix-turn-helix domain-containing protein [Streptomyces sp. NPDC000133]|uniref:helix-turn-helix domain-containing protein n=1 Tax=Streptomyces sp. NPDC000133 TaxID=3364535 RepID=UPI0036CC0396
MPRMDDDTTGTRIKEQRKLARLTQRQLADRIPYSYSLVNQVECGAKPANLDFVAAVAQALRVDVTVLTGQPYVTELQQDRLAGLVRPIREALDLYDLGADDAIPERSAAELVAAASQLCEQVRATRLRKAAKALPGTMAELTTAAWHTPSTELWQALASTYRTAHDISVKLGYYDLSAVALDRMDWAAQRASDPCLSAIRQYMRALVYFREGEYRIGQRLVAAGHGIVGGAEQTREAVAVTGQLVALHRMSAAVEMRQYDEALTQARQIRLPSTMATSRRAHFLIDKARSEMETGRTEAALSSIIDARHAAPEQTRYHPGARETIRGLVHISRRTPDTLGHMAAWIGL